MSYAPLDRIGSRPMVVSVSGTAAGSSATSVAPSTVPGIDYIRNARLFRGMAFSIEERQALGKTNYLLCYFKVLLK